MRAEQVSALQKASQAKSFPYSSFLRRSTNALLEIRLDGRVSQPRDTADYDEAIANGLLGQSHLLGIWTGSWGSDAFHIDKPQRILDAAGQQVANGINRRVTRKRSSTEQDLQATKPAESSVV
jgi:hypothetical protein